MARYLVRSRHGTMLYARVVVPIHLRPQLGKAALKKSLTTPDARIGKLLALEFAVQCKRLFASMAISRLTAKKITRHPDGRITLEDVVTDPQNPEKEAVLLNHLLTHNPVAPVNATAVSKPYQECVDAYMAVRPTVREKTKDEYVSIFREYGDWCNLNKYDPFIQPSAVAYIEQVLLTHSNSITTINKHIRRLSSLFIWCADRGYASKNIFHKLTLPKPKRRVSDEKKAYTHAEVAKLLANANPATDARHWVVLLGLYVGARANELASLYLKDIREIGGMPCIHFIEDSPDKRGGKTVNGERVVPIPNRLLELGFLEHVETLRRAGKTRLFECWKWHSKNGYWQYAGKWFREWRRKLGIEKDFHGLRHTFETGIRDAGVSETLAAELVGHAKGETQSFSRYAKPGHLANLREAINKLPLNPGRQA